MRGNGSNYNESKQFVVSSNILKYTNYIVERAGSPGLSPSTMHWNWVYQDFSMNKQFKEVFHRKHNLFKIHVSFLLGLEQSRPRILLSYMIAMSALISRRNRINISTFQATWKLFTTHYYLNWWVNTNRLLSLRC